jgi:SulP family sulfate permease
VLILGVFFVMLLPESGLVTIGELPLMMPGIHIPVFHLDIMLQQIFIGAVMPAALGSIDSLLTSLVSENITGVPHDSDRELIGQGVGNTVAGLFDGLPDAGATMRIMVNIQAGADGPLSGVLHAVILGLIALGLGSFFEHIPLALLAGILIKVGIDIIDWSFLRRVRQLPLLTLGLMTLVLLLTVFVNLIAAVLIGMFIKNLVTLDKLSTIQLGQLKIFNGLEETLAVSEEQAEFLRDNPALLVKLDCPLSYSVARGLGQRFQQLLTADKLVIELGQASFIGVTSALAIEDLIGVAQKDEMDVSVVDYRLTQHKELADVVITQMIPAERFYLFFSDFKTAVQTGKA